MKQAVFVNFKSLAKEYFENMSQALFFKDAYFGAAMLAMSIFFKPELFLCGTFASLIGFGYSTLKRTPKILRWTGLLPINGFFFGIALASLFQQNMQFYFCLAVGSLALPLITKAAFEVLQHWKLTPLIVPYILATWVLYLCGDGVALHYDPKLFTVETITLPFDSFISAPTQALIGSIFVSMGRIFFFQSLVYGFGLFLLVSIFSPRRGLYFFLGTALATITFYELSAGQNLWGDSYMSYSAGLVGLGLASLPEKFSSKTILLFCLISLFVTLALSRLLGVAHLPLLSLPYVLTFWFALLSRVPKLNVTWATVEAR